MGVPGSAAAGQLRVRAGRLKATGAITEADLASAYFAGRLAPLYAGFNSATDGKLSFKAFVERQGAATAHITTELLAQAAVRATGEVTWPGSPPGSAGHSPFTAWTGGTRVEAISRG